MRAIFSSQSQIRFVGFQVPGILASYLQTWAPTNLPTYKPFLLHRFAPRNDIVVHFFRCSYIFPSAVNFSPSHAMPGCVGDHAGSVTRVLARPLRKSDNIRCACTCPHTIASKPPAGASRRIFPGSPSQGTHRGVCVEYIVALANEDIINTSYGSRGTLSFDISPLAHLCRF